MQQKKRLKFPKNFLWGAALSAHQVEGGTHNQWSEWELENAKALAAQARHRYSQLDNWEQIAPFATDPDNYVSAKAVNHYELYKHDIAIAKKLELDCFRFSVEWSRIEPSEGTWNAEAISYYKQYVKELKRQGLEPIVTLFHFSLPVWFSELGGFERRKNIKYFTRFVEKIMNELGSYVRYVITINEPMIYAEQSYLEGVWPPQVHSKMAFTKVALNLASAHNQAAIVIKKINRRAKVSVAHHAVYYYGGDDALLTRLSASVMQYFSDDIFLGRVKRHCDFLGINYYVSNRVFGYRIHNEETDISDLGWVIEPENIEFVVERLHKKYKLPILITENGLADSRDAKRKQWLIKTLSALQRAQQEGVVLLGYIHWSLLDNFEWAHGKWPRFGLVEVDYETFQRRVRPSAIWFSKVIRQIRGNE